MPAAVPDTGGMTTGTDRRIAGAANRHFRLATLQITESRHTTPNTKAQAEDSVVFI